MSWSWAYLAVSLLGALLVANAFAPPRQAAFAVPSFFAGWYTGELPLWHVVWQAAATVAFGFAGAFGHWPGWVGLAVAVSSWVGLGVLARTGQQARHVFMRAEEEVPLPPLEDSVLPRHGGETMWRFPRVAYPLARPTRSVRVVRNVDYVGDGRTAHRLDVITRRLDPPEAAPVLLHVHGGAWIIGDKREQGFPLMYEAARHGWVCVTINYALSPRATWPDHVVDCKRALAWVKTHIGDYGGDPGFVAVTGGSAGGHLSALMALSPGDPAFQPGFEDEDTSVQACVPVYGIYDMTAGHGSVASSLYDRGLARLLERQVFKARIEEDPTKFEQASPLYRVRSDAPPFFVIHGTNDTLASVASARQFVRALRAVSRSPVLYAELPRTQHAFDVLPSVRSAHAVAAIVRFLEGVRRREPAQAPGPP
ncbi:MAG TPA: alpha/beta hydrolase [Acidimicrobiales bacterium]|nr:alpha/beta hydrolase [Acidimicrobiales bacterium]